MQRAVTWLLMGCILLAPLSGCLGPIGTIDNPTDEPEPSLVSFPEFNYTADDGLEYNNSVMLGESWIAYFSAPWCKHCELTLDAVDQITPAERLLVFSKDNSTLYENMTEWKEVTEGELEREVNRPFMDAPALAQEVEVLGIPHLMFIRSDGTISEISTGALTNQTVIQGYLNNATA